MRVRGAGVFLRHSNRDLTLPSSYLPGGFNPYMIIGVVSKIVSLGLSRSLRGTVKQRIEFRAEAPCSSVSDLYVDLWVIFLVEATMAGSHSYVNLILEKYL